MVDMNTEARLLADLAGLLPRRLRPLLAALHRANRRLWRLEDRAREVDSDRERGAVKRQIDRANLARHRCVGELDAAVLQLFPRGARAGGRGAHLTSESLGQMLDRASILVLKRARLDDARVPARLDHLRACIAEALRALAAGRFVHHPVGEVKRYGAC
jgi:hypothetical protein